MMPESLKKSFLLQIHILKANYSKQFVFLVYAFHCTIDSSNALELVRQFDCVIDCTDNVATRYLLNDACFLAKSNSRIPLVSGAALRWDGQITVYEKDSCCYR